MKSLNRAVIGQLIRRKIIQFVTNTCQILRLKCTKFNFGWASTPDPAGGAYSLQPQTLSWIKGPTSKGKGGGTRGEKEKGMKGRGGELRLCC